MATLRDLKKCMADMTEEELAQAIRDSRTERRTASRVNTSKSKSTKLQLDIPQPDIKNIDTDSMSLEDMEALLDALGGSEDD
jgi:hypothetical protein